MPGKASTAVSDALCRALAQPGPQKGFFTIYGLTDESRFSHAAAINPHDTGFEGRLDAVDQALSGPDPARKNRRQERLRRFSDGWQHLALAACETLGQ